MKTSTYSIFFAVLSIIAIYLILTRLKKDNMGIRSALIWMILWFGIGFFSLFPELLNMAMRFAQMENRMFFILVSAVFILFALVFNLNARMDKMQRDIARLVQELSILNYKIDAGVTNKPANRKEEAGE